MRLSLLILAMLAWACNSDPQGATTPEVEASTSCEAALELMSACYPELRDAARCTEETLAQIESSDLSAQGCEAAEAMGKADLFSMGGCGEGEHACGWLFCCDDYTLTWSPDAEDWEIIEVIAAFQAEIPEAIRAAREAEDLMTLLDGVSDHWKQSVVEYPGEPAKEMGVEWTQRLVEVPFEDFTQKLSPEAWGLSLAHYLGGELEVYERDAEGRAIRQVERMVLSAMPCDYETPLLNNDMTKVEVIRYAEGSARIDWRVMHSDNGSTEADVGSLTFEAYAGGTLITFHSAHRLAVMGLHVPNGFILGALSDTFLDHAERYRELTQ